MAPPSGGNAGCLMLRQVHPAR